MADDKEPESLVVEASNRALSAVKPLENKEDRVFVLPVSSEEPYQRTHASVGQYNEVLGHEDGEINMRRLEGAPLLLNHDRQGIQVGVVLRAFLQEARLYVEARFSRKNSVAEVLQDVRDGITRNVSIGYSVEKMKRAAAKVAGALPTYRATAWTPYEVSLVTVPADPTVGFNRADDAEAEGPAVDTEVTTVSEAEIPTTNEHLGREDTAVTTEDEQMPEEKEIVTPAVDLVAERAVWAAEEQQRQADVAAVFAPFHGQHGELSAQCRADMSVSASDASQRLLAAMAAGAASVSAGPTVQVDARDKFRAGAEVALAVRSGVEDADMTGNEFAGASLVDIAKLSLRHASIDSHGDPMELIGRAITSSTSDFPNLLANLANKGLMKGFNHSAETYQAWTRAGSVADFKSVSRVALGGISTLDEIYENSEYKHGALSEFVETGTLRTWGKIMNFSRQMILNDDLNGLQRVPFLMGVRAQEKVGDLAYATLTANANLSDAVALFATARGNLVTSGAVPSTATVEAGRAALGNYTARTGEAVTVIPKYLLCAHGLLGTARAVLESDAWVGTLGAASDTKNIVKGLVQPIADRRLDAYASGAPWFLVPDPQIYDTVELLYLNGRKTPVLERQNAFNQDGVELKIRFDVAALVLDANMYQNDGVT